jgi:hypothetical protein
VLLGPGGFDAIRLSNDQEKGGQDQRQFMRSSNFALTYSDVFCPSWLLDASRESVPRTYSFPSVATTLQSNKEECSMSETSTLIGYGYRTIGREEVTLVPTPAPASNKNYLVSSEAKSKLKSEIWPY